MRRRFTTSASLKSNEIRRWPLVGAVAGGAAGVAWASRRGGAAGIGAGTGAAAAAGAGSTGAADAGAAGAPDEGAVGAGVACASIGDVGMTMARPFGSSRIA